MGKEISDKDYSNTGILETMFIAFYPVLAAYCNKYVKDEEVARDIIQDIFLNVWEKRQDIDFSTPLHSYLLRLAHNSCVNYLQRVKVEKKYQQSIAMQLMEMEATYDDIFNQLSANAIQQQIDQCIAELPEQCKKIFIKSRYDGLSHKIIAQEMSISVRTVETQIYRALKAIKKALPCLIVRWWHFSAKVYLVKNYRQNVKSWQDNRTWMESVGVCRR